MPPDPGEGWLLASVGSQLASQGPGLQAGLVLLACPGEDAFFGTPEVFVLMLSSKAALQRYLCSGSGLGLCPSSTG